MSILDVRTVEMDDKHLRFQYDDCGMLENSSANLVHGKWIIIIKVRWKQPFQCVEAFLEKTTQVAPA